MTQPFLDFQKLNGTTWFYLSFLLYLSVYFRFDRFFSLRNWDVVALFLLVPGLLVTHQAERQLSAAATGTAVAPDVAALKQAARMGYAWLFGISGVLLVRALMDLALTRRPRLEPNLNISGLACLAVSLFGFMVYEVMVKDLEGGRRAADVAEVASPANRTEPLSQAATNLLKSAIRPVVNEVVDRIQEEQPIRHSDLEIAAARSTAILAHVLLIAGLILIGWRHFDSPATGMGMATLYLLLPTTAINVEKIDHLLPSVFLVWAVFAYRRPWVSGILFGFASIFIYPLFLLPAWTGFYWRRGARRFLLGCAIVAVSMSALLLFLKPPASLLELWASSSAWRAWDFRQVTSTLGFWTPATQVFRLPIFVVFVAAVIGTAFWPQGKNLADLIALSTIVTLGTQFWYADRGGTYIHWYLPLYLMMVFRPNLQAVRAPEVRPGGTAR